MGTKEFSIGREYIELLLADCQDFLERASAFCEKALFIMAPDLKPAEIKELIEDINEDDLSDSLSRIEAEWEESADEEFMDLIRKESRELILPSPEAISITKSTWATYSGKWKKKMQRFRDVLKDECARLKNLKESLGKVLKKRLSSVRLTRSTSYTWLHGKLSVFKNSLEEMFIYQNLLDRAKELVINMSMMKSNPDEPSTSRDFETELRMCEELEKKTEEQYTKIEMDMEALKDIVEKSGKRLSPNAERKASIIIQRKIKTLIALKVVTLLEFNDLVNKLKSEPLIAELCKEYQNSVNNQIKNKDSARIQKPESSTAQFKEERSAMKAKLRKCSAKVGPDPSIDTTHEPFRSTREHGAIPKNIPKLQATETKLEGIPTAKMKEKQSSRTKRRRKLSSKVEPAPFQESEVEIGKETVSPKKLPKRSSQTFEFVAEGDESVGSSSTTSGPVQPSETLQMALDESSKDTISGLMDNTSL